MPCSGRIAAATVSALLAAMALPAHSQPASPAEAARLTAALHWYFGSLADAANIEPKGEAYRMVLRPQDWLAHLPASRQSMSGSRLESVSLDLTPTGPGLWKVHLDQPLFFKAGFEGFGFTYHATSYRIDGTFDESLMAFRDSETDVVGQWASVTIGDRAVSTEVRRHQHTVSRAQPGLLGGLDLTVTDLTEGQVQTPFAMDATDRARPETRMETATSKTEVTGLRLSQLLQIAHWFTAHQALPQNAGEWGELRLLILGALPLFDRMVGDATFQDVSTLLPMPDADGAWPIGVAQAQIKLDLQGLIAQGGTRLSMSLSGITLPLELVPDWARPLAPQSLSLGIGVSGFNAAAPLAFLISAQDWPPTAPALPDAQSAHALALAVPSGRLTLTLEPGHVAGQGFDIGYDGQLFLPVDGAAPVGQMTLSVAGLDQIIEAVRRAPDGAGPAMALGGLRGLAESDDAGRLIWRLRLDDRGKLWVNGVDTANLGVPL